ncbi:MAG: OsmC family protein [Pseudomonadota bacterium]
MSEKTFTVNLKLLENYLFQIDFGEFGNLLSDEPAPLGGGEGPSPAGLLAASVANCLSASLLYALRRHKEDPGELTATITGRFGRVEKFLRITHFDVEIRLGSNMSTLPTLVSAVAQFENYCTITQSVRQGIEVDVAIFDSDGVLVHRNPPAQLS